MNLPIAERELRLAAKRPRTYLARMGGCVIFGLIVGWMFWFGMKMGPINTVAPQVYGFITYLALMGCMFSANMTSDALSSEKRDGTLGLLFLTDLRGVDIVFGKLVATGLMSFYGLLATIPVLAMPVLMGGVSGESVFRTALTLVNALFLALSLGLWVSARSWHQKKAKNATVWIVLFLLWMLPALSALARYRYHWAELADFLFLLSPIYQQSHANPFGLGMITDKYWTSLAITHAFGWLALWRACAVLPRAWQDRAIVSVRGGWKRFWQNLHFGSPEARAAHRRRLLEINAVHWLSSREKLAPLWTWAFVAIVVLSWVGLWIWMKVNALNGPPFWGMGIPALFALVLGMRLRTCAVVGEVITRDRFSGALELLLSTTLTVREVARGQWLTFFRTLARPAIAVIVIGFAVFFGGMAEIRRGGDDVETNVIVIFIGLTSMFVVDLIASVWTGMWTACISRTPAGAPGQALVRLLLLPWFIFVATMTFLAYFELNQGLDFLPGFISWWFFFMANNIFWTITSRRKFYQRLRIVASERYQPLAAKRKWWKLGFIARQPAQEISLSKAV